MKDWRATENALRGGNWTMLREIIGTIIGALPFAAMGFGWGVHIETISAVNTADIRHLQEQRLEISQKLDTISNRMDQIGKDVATVAAKVNK